MRLTIMLFALAGCPLVLQGCEDGSRQLLDGQQDGGRAADGGIKDVPQDSGVQDADNSVDADPLPPTSCVARRPVACPMNLSLAFTQSLPQTGALRDLMNHDDRIYVLQDELWQSPDSPDSQSNFQPILVNGPEPQSILSVAGSETSAMVIAEESAFLLRSGSLLRAYPLNGSGKKALPRTLIANTLRIGEPSDLGLEWARYPEARRFPTFPGSDDIVARSNSIGTLFIGTRSGAILLEERGDDRRLVHPEDSATQPELINLGTRSDAHHFLLDSEGNFFEYCDGAFQARTSPGAPIEGTEHLEHMFVPDHNGQMLVAATASGVSSSCDGGRSWRSRETTPQHGITSAQNGFVTAREGFVERWLVE